MFKKFLLIVFSFVIAVSVVLTGTAVTDDNNDVTEMIMPVDIADESAKVIVSDVSGKIGDTVSVDVVMENNPGIAAFRFFIDFDESYLEPVSVSKGEAVSAGNIYSNVSLKDISVIVTTWDNASDVSMNGVVFTMVFRIKDTSGMTKYPLTLAYNQVDVCNENFEDVYFEIIDGSITVNGFDVFTDGSTEIETGETLQMLVSLSESNVLKKEIIWSSDNELVATVDENGLVTGVGEGNATITATIAGSSCSASCEISVEEPVVLRSIRINTMPEKTSYYIGETFEQNGLTLTAEYSDGSSVIIENGFTCSATSFETAGEYTVTVTYEGMTAEFTVTVERLYYTVKWIVDGVTTAVEYKLGETIALPEEPVKDGYVFTGWCPEVPATMPAYDCEFTAVFEKYIPEHLGGRFEGTFFWDLYPGTGELIISGEGSLSNLYDCPWLEYSEYINTVVIEGNIWFVDFSFFDWVSQNISVVIGEKAEYVFGSLNSDYRYITSITVDPDNLFYSSDEYGVLFDKDKVNLVIYPAGNTRTTYTIPDGVKYIHDWAFAGCDYLRAVTFPDSVTDIGYSAFRECRMLRSLINLPDGITKIGRGAFDDTGVWGNTEDGVKYIGKYLIKAECSISGTYKVKEGTKLIADGAFYNCDSLSSIEIADTVTHIGDDAFFSCDALTSVTIPSSVTDIGSNAFYGCKNLTDIYYDGGSEEWEKIDVGSYNTELDSATIHFRYYTVTLDAKNGSFSDGKSLITFNAEPGEVIDFETPILKNYILKGWVDSQGNDIPSPYTMTEGNITLYANWIFDEEGHTHELKTTTVAPTCTESGKEYSVCVLCNKQISETVIPPLNHNSVRTEYTPPTCTSAGIANEYCELCDVFVRSYEYASPLEHTPGEWETVKDSTCYEDGQRIRRCLVCGNIAETEGVESLKHKLKTVTIESTCTVQGMKYDICEICGDVIGDTVVLPLKEHTASEWEVVTPATCTTDGKKIKKCVDCNAPLETEVIGMLGHTPSDEWEVVTPATCTADGKKIKKCTVCGEIAETAVIPATGHTTRTVTIESTCTVQGMKYDICEVCGDVIGETVVLPLKEHTASEWEVVTPATCTTDGKKIKKCVDCNAPLETEVIGMLGHTPSDEWEIVTPATCTADGKKIKRCTVCGEIAETAVIPATGHTCRTVTIESTCTVQGMKYDICEICGDVIGDTVVLPLKEHTVGEWEVVTPATCTTDGKKIKKCVDCNAPLESEVIGMLGHTPSDEWEVVSQPTVDAEGKRVKRCTVCGEITEEEVISKLEVVRDEDTDVSIVYQPEDYDGEISINVEETFDGGAFSLINTQLNSSEAQIFDITMTVDGVEIQPKGKITVRIPLPEGYNENRSFVYYVNTRTGNVEKMNSRFENGYLVFETDHFSYYAVVDESQTIPSVIEVLIRKPSTTTINYGDSIILHIDIQSELPKNATIIWSAGNGNFDYTVSSDGTTCTITPKSSGDTTFTVTVVDENGNEIGSATQSMTSKAGFFKKFVAFFKKLFGLTKVIPEAFKVIN